MTDQDTHAPIEGGLRPPFSCQIQERIAVSRMLAYKIDTAYRTGTWMNETLRRRLLYLLLPGCVMAMGTTQCQIGSQGDSPDFVTTISIQDVNGQDSENFAAGQQIQFVVSIRNRSNSAQTLDFADAQIYDFYVVNSGTSDVVWHWSAGQAFAQNVNSIDFSAGQSRSYTVMWTQLDDDGQAAAPGDYEVQGRIVTQSDTAVSDDFQPSDYRSNLTPFTIEP